PSNCSLTAGNDNPIHTYGQLSFLLTLRLRREYRWVFVIVDVRQPILGSDFLIHYNWWVKLKHMRLFDTDTQFSAKCQSIFISSAQPLLVSPLDNSVIGNLLRKFSKLAGPNFHRSCPKHSTTHSVITNGNPVFAGRHRLPPDRYAKAKDEFQHILQLGIIRLSKNMLASPLHMVP
ncbi:uncharacterized protein DEA37_0015027, partial [Paragonimus westermani]